MTGESPSTSEPELVLRSATAALSEAGCRGMRSAVLLKVSAIHHVTGRILASAIILLAAAKNGSGAVPKPSTYVYKRADNLDIQADVYRPASAQGLHPVVVYMHGGSLIGGDRSKIMKNAYLLEKFVGAGCVVVSIDYRLAPETKLPALVSDVEDAFHWVREKGPALFGADPERVASWGTSAGGYLAFLTGHRVKPALRAVLAEYGYADIVGPWQMEPSHDPEHYEAKSNFATEADAWREVSGPPIVNKAQRRGNGDAFNGYVRQRGLWPKAVTGWDPHKEIDKYVPYLPVRNVTAEYPPIFIIHGREDQDIPFAVAEQMARELEKHHVEHRLVGIDHGRHGYIGADPADVARAHDEAFEFLKTHLGLGDAAASRRGASSATAK